MHDRTPNKPCVQSRTPIGLLEPLYSSNAFFIFYPVKYCKKASDNHAFCHLLTLSQGQKHNSGNYNQNSVQSTQQSDNNHQIKINSALLINSGNKQPNATLGSEPYQIRDCIYYYNKLYLTCMFYVMVCLKSLSVYTSM